MDQLLQHISPVAPATFERRQILVVGLGIVLALENVVLPIQPESVQRSPLLNCPRPRLFCIKRSSIRLGELSLRG